LKNARVRVVGPHFRPSQVCHYFGRCNSFQLIAVQIGGCFQSLFELKQKHCCFVLSSNKCCWTYIIG
jgi:hypothetical protein